MGPSPKPKSNLSPIEPINSGSLPHFTHSESPEFKIQTVRSIELPSEKGKKLQSFRKYELATCRSGVRSIQSSLADFATFKIKQSRPRIIQVIKRLN